MTGPEPRCSVSAQDEPLIGTAPRARAWLVLEQPGPYGFSALTESHLPEGVRTALGALPKDSGTTVLLARRVGHHADDRGHDGPRRFWFAHTAPGGIRMRSGRLEDSALLRPDLPDVLAAAAGGQLPPWGSVSREPLLLVCTNARRDVCCALEGRPVAEALAADPAYADRVLETSHLGGHRFAPTALLLPSGFAYGRIDADDARAILDAAADGRLGAAHRLRGRTALAQPCQVAAAAVREHAAVGDLDDLDALRVAGDRVVPAGLRWQGDEGAAEVEVRHHDGRAWRVVVTRSTLEPPRPESCGKAPVAAQVWTAQDPVVASPWTQG